MIPAALVLGVISFWLLNLCWDIQEDWNTPMRLAVAAMFGRFLSFVLALAALVCLYFT